ncbi:translation elongation factor-like protein [Candidatus Woesearchaeota archaeon]|nr:translation elongation factor-like protein [Candidatus Woesearchaeota archaeon]
MAEEKKESLGREVGKVKHYFSNISVGIIKLKGSLSVGDKIRIKGAITDFEQKIGSMQIEHEKVEKAKKDQSIGLKTKDTVREQDIVYKL